MIFSYISNMNIVDNYDLLIYEDIIESNLYVTIDEHLKGSYNIYYTFKKELLN